MARPFSKSRHKNRLRLLLVILFLCSGCALKEKLYFRAPTELPFVTREMKTAGYWISRHPSPDRIILDSKKIEQFNERVKELKLIENIRPDGFITHYADQRFEPTSKPRYEKPGDVDFDEQQNSALDVGTPVAILEYSHDKQWINVASESSRGWVQADKIEKGDRHLCPLFSEEMEKGTEVSVPFFVVIRPKADIYLDTQLTKYYDHVQMGTMFPLVKKINDEVIKIPLGYMHAQDVHEDYLTFTVRNVFQQAFELLNSPYGWGGMYGEQDCSRFLQQIFATVGIKLPRDSKNQARVGLKFVEFTKESTDQEKIDALKKINDGIVILTMKGHIMLYLGIVEDRPYAIHSVWAYREPTLHGDRIRVINRVAVTDLSLGQGSKKGSLLKRLSGIVFIQNEEPLPN